MVKKYMNNGCPAVLNNSQPQFPMASKGTAPRSGYIGIALIGIVWSIFSLFSPNPLLCVPAFLTLGWLYFLFGRSPFYYGLLAALVMQWLQVSMDVLRVNWTGLSLADESMFSTHIVTAYLAACLALAMFGSGIFFGLKKIRFSMDMVRAEAEQYDFPRLAKAWLVLLFVFMFLPLLKSMLPGIAQLLMPVYKYQTAIFFMLFAIAFFGTRKSRQWLLLGFLCFQILQGFLGYFSGFKNFIILFVVYYVSVCRLKITRLLWLLLLLGGLFYLLMFWQSVKGEYRIFLNQETGEQVKLVSNADAANFIWLRLSEYSAGQENFDNVLRRIGYINFLSGTMDTVPQRIPYRYGASMMEAVQHILIPRILVPSKPILDDSLDATKYTATYFGGLAQGNSVSIGYAAYFYIDWGLWLMFPMIFLFGWFLGWTVSVVVKSFDSRLAGWGITMTYIFIFGRFETTLVKILGASVSSLIVLFVLNRLFFNQWLARFRHPAAVAGDAEMRENNL